jgi:hypothetical protein
VTGRARTGLAAAGVAAALALVSPWRVPLSSDGSLVLRTALALAFEGTFRLPLPPAGARVNPFYLRAAPRGGLVAVYAPLGALLRAGTVTLSRAVPAGAARGAAADAGLSLLPILCAAATVFPLVRLARYGGAGKRIAPLLAGALLLTTFLGPLSVSDYQEPALVLLLAWSLERALAARRRPPGRRAGPFAASGAFLSLALLAKPSALVLAPALILAAAGPRRARRPVADLAALAAGGMPGAILALVLNALRFGSALESGYGGQLAEPLARAVSPLWSALRLTVLPNRGLLFFAPVLLLVLPGLAARLRTGPRRVDRAAALLGAGAFFATAVSWFSWESGMGWGPRLLAPCVALLAPALAVDTPGRKRALAALAAAGLCVNGPGLLLDSGRLYAVVASRPLAGRPLGPVVPLHAQASAPGGLHPYQRVHYVPASATWLVAPGVLATLLRAGDGPEAGGPGRPDAFLLGVLGGARVPRAGSDTGRALLEEAFATADVEPARALRMAEGAVAWAGPPVDARAVASALELRAGRFPEALRLAREGLALDPSREDLRTNFALAERGLGGRQ